MIARYAKEKYRWGFLFAMMSSKCFIFKGINVIKNKNINKIMEYFAVFRKSIAIAKEKLEPLHR